MMGVERRRSVAGHLPAGRPLGCTSSRQGQVHVSAADDGVLAGWPGQDGNLADAGAPLARLYPEVSQ